jgi:N-methylhydantoinase A
LTLLSGPAAGIAGALLYERLSDGIFVEIGGTSSDCSAIRAGHPQMQPATIGGHRTMLRTLDVRTLGIGGGSMLRIVGNEIRDVGPRSAHIAGCAYAAFAAPEALDGARFELIAPAPRDRPEYAILVARDGTRIAPTATCAANLLGAIPTNAFARGNAESAQRAFELVARRLGTDAIALARRVLALAAAKLRDAIDQLIADYALDRDAVVIVGGGGGAGALVPAVAATMRLRYRIARDAEVIAPIGVALALVRDVVERTIFSPSPEEIARVRREAADRVVAAGAAPDRVEVELEIDTQRSRVRAIASGATALVESAGAVVCDPGKRRAAAAESLRCDPGALEVVQLTTALTAYRYQRAVRVIDDGGTIRLSLRDPVLVETTVRELETRVRDAVEGATQFGDVGRALPALYLLRGARVAAYEGLTSADQAAALVAEETQGCAPDDRLTLLLVRRQA